MAPGGTGDEPVKVLSKRPVGRRGLQIGLYALALLLGCAVVFGAVLDAARKEIDAFVNIDYQDAQASIDAVAAGATGDFAKQYDTSTKDVVKILTQAKSVMEGKVLWAGVVDADKDSASVIVATTGTVANTSTGNKPVARQFRIKVDLVHQDDAWKTSNVEFVG